MYRNLNKHNAMIWGSENPIETRDVSRDSDKVTLWSALSFDRGIGPYCFDQSIVTDDSYLHLLNNYLLPVLSELPANILLARRGLFSLYLSSAKRIG